MTLTAPLLLVLGFILLIKGADWMVDGASSIARRLGVSDLAIGLTIIAFGTSMPELIVNIFASIGGNADIAIGNVVGSNISNILLILGATALIMPLAVQSSSVRKEIPFSLLATITLAIMANDNLVDGYMRSELSRGDGLTFIGFFVIFLYYTFGLSTENVRNDGDDTPIKPLPVALLLTVSGMLGLIVGGKLAVDNASAIAAAFGVSQAMIGLTVVAIGTSLPELVSSVVAARKGKADIAVGNVVGSNIFNIFWILGVSAIIKPLPFGSSINADLLTVIGATLLLLLVTHQGTLHKRLLFWWRPQSYVIQRWEGGLLLASYIVYMGFVIWRG